MLWIRYIAAIFLNPNVALGNPAEGKLNGLNPRCCTIPTTETNSAVPIQTRRRPVSWDGFIRFANARNRSTPLSILVISRRLATGWLAALSETILAAR
jgi:hypothetical protein